MFDNFSVTDNEEIIGFNRTKVPFIKFANGKTVFRILPPHAEANGKWFRIIRRHNLFFSRDQGRLNRSVTCPEDNCILCDYGHSIYNESGEANLLFAKKVAAQEETFVNSLIFAANTEFKVGTIYLMRLPKRVFQTIYGWDRDEQMGWDDVTGVKAWSQGKGLMGVKFVVERQGTTLTNTKYTLSAMPKREDLVQELANLGVDASHLEMVNMYAPESSLSLSDDKYVDDTLALLKKEYTRATTNFESGTMVMDNKDMFKGHPESTGAGVLGPIGSVSPGVRPVVPLPSEFKFNQ